MEETGKQNQTITNIFNAKVCNISDFIVDLPNNIVHISVFGKIFDDRMMRVIAS